MWIRKDVKLQKCETISLWKYYIVKIQNKLNTKLQIYRKKYIYCEEEKKCVNRNVEN